MCVEIKKDGFKNTMFSPPSLINKSLFKRSVNFFIVAVSITLLAMIITYLINPDLKETMEGVGNRLPDDVKESTGIAKVWSYIVNNGFMVPLQMLVLSLIPIQFLYFINIILTVSLPGILFGIALRGDFGEGFKIIISSIPHYVFEVFALCLLAAVLFKLNRVVRTKIRNIFKKDKYKVSFIREGLASIKVYLYFALPIIIIAAFLETYIGDIIINLFH